MAAALRGAVVRAAPFQQVRQLLQLRVYSSNDVLCLMYAGV
jgi:hypothetical protein